MNSTPQQTFPAAGAKRVAAQSTRLGRLAGWCYDHRRWVLLLWIVAVVVISGWGNSLGSNYSDKFSGGNSESSKALHLLQDRFPAKAGDTADIVFHSNDNIAAHQPQIEGVLSQVDALGAKNHVEGVVSPYSPEGSRQIATQAPGAGHTVYAVVQFDKPTADIPTAAAKKVIDTARNATKNSAPGVQVEFGGSPVYKAEPISLGSAELIGIVAAIFILLIAFGSIVAM
ncbi:MAG: MMPL family transporter, partial [Acidimicrobiales bacterium]